MTRPKISRTEDPGPLRTGLKSISEALGPENGGKVYEEAFNLAEAGLDMTLDLYEKHNGLGDPDKSIPPTFNAVKVLRDRGIYVGYDSPSLKKTRA